MIEGVVVDKEVHKEVEGDGETEKDLDDGEVNGEEEIDNHDVQETDAEIEKELGDGEVNGEKEIDNDDVQDIDAEVEENLHEVDEVDEVEAYDEESDEEGDDTTTKLLLRSQPTTGTPKSRPPGPGQSMRKKLKPRRGRVWKP
ncbi:hypothetical protein DEO72_LG2g5261 [Vigna unguiculata]|uniref:Uncharacterized protein n=1 Tax=Vigna unguiculata TaxID=3917 RepID=A0A4D6L8P5_VIGUN|nr:hypothetical protein DEO72_LG2g5261 [Vigna unguiculata]